MTKNYFHKKVPPLVGLLLIVIVGLVFCLPSSAQAQLVRQSTPGDLFYNFYVPPVGPRSVGAELYPCPRPTPPMVGHTYITYQPLMPHEFLYRHHRRYVTFHEDAPRTRTTVHWR